MTGNSLRWRLLAGAGVAIAVALAVAWAAMAWVFDRHIERRVQDELATQAVPLLAGLRLANGAPMVDEEPADPRFAVPAGGLYWQVDGAKGQVRSRSLWDSRLPPPGKVAADSWQARRIAGPFGQALLVVQREVRLSPDAPGVTVRVAYDRAQLAPARREFGRELGLFLALLWLVLALAAWLQVNLGLRPLGTTPAEFRSTLDEQRAKWTAIARAHDIKPKRQ